MKKLFFIFGLDKVEELSAEEKAYFIGFEINGVYYMLERPREKLDLEKAEAIKNEIAESLPGKLMLPDIDECLLLHKNFDAVNHLLQVLGRPLLERGDYWTSVKTSGEKYFDFDMWQGGWYPEDTKTENHVIYCFV